MMIKKSKKPTINPSLIVLQWLTYAFWGWTVLATSILTINVMSYVIKPDNNSDFAIYATAAVLVLLPISVICDFFYSKKEPSHKSGAASIIMIIHAVLFALFGIAALISIVFSLVQLMISSSNVADIQIALYSEPIIAILYGAIFIRTLLPVKIIKLRKYFSAIMITIIGIVSIISFLGPINNAWLTRDDRLIDANISYIQLGIESYTNNKNQLPENITGLVLSGDAKVLIDRNLINYKPNTKQPSISTSDLASNESITTYYYELCVNYKKAINGNGSSAPIYRSGTIDNDGYDVYIDTNSHPAGEYCYKIRSSIYPTKL